MTSGDHVSIVISKPNRATCWTAGYAAGQRRHTNTSIHVPVWRRTFMHHVVLNATDTTMVFRTVIIQRMKPLHIPTAELDGKGVIFSSCAHALSQSRQHQPIFGVSLITSFTQLFSMLVNVRCYFITRLPLCWWKLLQLINTSTWTHAHCQPTCDFLICTHNPTHRCTLCCQIKDLVKELPTKRVEYIHWYI